MPNSPAEDASIRLIRKRFASFEKRAATLKRTNGISLALKKKVNSIINGESEFKSRVFKKMENGKNGKELLVYIHKGLVSFDDGLIRIKESISAHHKLKKKIQRKRWELEDLEKRIDGIIKSKELRPKEKKMLKEKIKKSIRSTHRRLQLKGGVTSIELNKINKKISILKTKLKPIEEQVSKRRYLHRLGTPHYLHSVFDDVNIHTIKTIHNKWKKKKVEEIGEMTGISHEKIIALARSLGWPTLDESLSWWKNRYKNLQVREPIDVTDFFSDYLRTINSRMIQKRLSKGDKVYAIPLYSGKGCFKKWGLRYKSKEIERTVDLSAQITNSPTSMVGAWICSKGHADTRNIGYDEISLEGEDALEGINRKTADDLHNWLGLEKEDTYVIMVREEKELDKDFREFKERIESVLKHGANARRRFYHPSGKDELESVITQAHPLIKNEVIDWYHKRKEKGELNYGQDIIILDETNP